MAAFLTKKSWYGTVKVFLGPYHHDLKSNKTIEQGGVSSWSWNHKLGDNSKLKWVSFSKGCIYWRGFEIVGVCMWWGGQKSKIWGSIQSLYFEPNLREPQLRFSNRKLEHWLKMCSCTYTLFEGFVFSFLYLLL